MKKILLIEDAFTFSSLLGVSLKNRGYGVEIASDGVEGLRKASEYRPDLIILDVNLPTLSGFDVAKRLKENADLKGIPVVMFTALTQDVNIRRGYLCGVADYITKPFPIEHLLLKIKKYLGE